MQSDGREKPAPMGTLDDLTEGSSGKRILTEWRETQPLVYAMGEWPARRPWWGSCGGRYAVRSLICSEIPPGSGQQEGMPPV